MTCYLRTYIDQYRPTSDHILKQCVYRKFEFTGLLFCPRKRNSKKKNKQAQRRAAAETVARKLIEHFIHSINN